MLKKKNLALGIIVGLLFVLLAGCASTQRPFTSTYKGEAEPLLAGTRWELQDLKSIDNLTFVVEFQADGSVLWYNLPRQFNASLSEKSTWERTGNNVVFNARNGFYLYEGRITIVEDDKNTAAGRYKTGYDKRVLKSNPSGDFSMTEQ